MRVQKVTVLTHEDVEQDRPGKVVVVGMAEYLAYAKKYKKPAVELLTGDNGLNIEGWAFATWSRLRRIEPEATSEDFEEWTAGIAQALPDMIVNVVERAEAEIKAGGGGAEAADPTSTPTPEETSDLTTTPGD